jgi:hypothetical protein
MRPAGVPPGLRADNGNQSHIPSVPLHEQGYPLPNLELHQMRRLASLVSLLLLVSGCGAAASTHVPTPTEAPSTSIVGFELRAWITQALPPIGFFPSAGPSVAIDHDRLITYGPQIAIYPGPLLPNLQQRPISQAGTDVITAAARTAGLLDGPTDLVGESLPGSQTGHLLFTIDGVEREVFGDPTRQIVCITAPCVAPPGTPEAFGQFWAQVHDIPSWLGAELGPEIPFVPDRLAILLIEPVPEPEVQPSIATWPLSTSRAQFGVEWPGSPPARCGVIDGDDLTTALAAFRTANELTIWIDEADARFSVVARPLFPSEPDPC